MVLTPTPPKLGDDIHNVQFPTKLGDDIHNVQLIAHCQLFILIFLTILFTATPVKAAVTPGIDSIQVSTGFIASKQAPPPFWMWANKNGRVSMDNASSIFTRLRINKHPDDEKEFDWFYGADVTARTGSPKDIVWTDAYAGLTYKKFKLTLGRKAETFGLVDSLLSVGSEVYSQNAPTIPKIAISTNGYIELTENLAFNAYFANGWMGTEQYVKNACVQQKFLYIRLGDTDPDHGINFYAGLHDLASWAGDGQPSSFTDFWRVFFGRAGGSNAQTTDQQNALGDHRGTIEFALQQKDVDRDWFLYAQTMFEDGSGLRFWYPGDFLLGISMVNKEKGSPIARINLEILDTRYDGNSLSDIDNYFANGVYSGWVHQGYAIGTPFVPFIQSANYQYDPLNRVQVINGAVTMRLTKLINPRFRIAYIQNYGSFTEPLPNSQKTTTIATDITNTTPIAQGWTLTQQIALDASQSSHPNPAITLTLTKTLN